MLKLGSQQGDMLNTSCLACVTCCTGVWADTDWHGERVQGVWEHGVLKGPFKARETGAYLPCLHLSSSAI